ncbi:hypothetical protein PHAVU_007G068600 [Phaseolus vulgaris]|uniref:Uncharacterized protein n=1 Tax=Phaseolus vulgaris TaxID=3885 RepID=V7BC30_PHAVU|nr:hypothetical protein PHAVU_007G068600g [Phaseolus vulgaris]ESW15384.1 hypothetical protein PHAVU_007G068600g [Phaseolus vulgaris]
MSAPKFSALLLFVIIFLSSVLDSYSTSRLDSHVNLGTKSSDRKVSFEIVENHHVILSSLKTEKPNKKNPNISIKRKVPAGPNPLHNS